MKYVKLALVALLTMPLISCHGSSKPAAPTATTDGERGKPEVASEPESPTAGAALSPPADTNTDGPRHRADVSPAATPANGSVFFGLPVAEHRVVFAVTRAGGMTDTMQDVKGLLKQSIQQLAPTQYFDVIFWSAGPASEMPGGMVPATAENKKAALEFVDPIIPRGANDPEYGLRAAFASRPDAIYLLTHGEFDKAVSRLVTALNVDRTTVVNVVHLVWPSSNPDAERVMRQIADENGGTYVRITQDDLKRLAKGKE